MEKKDQISDLLKDFAAGKTLGEMRGFTPDELEAVYSVGYTYYRTGRFEDAEKLFRFVCLFDHVTSKYWLALGAVLQAQRKFRDAIKPYGCAMLFDIKDPRPYFHLAECQLALGDFGEALLAIDTLEKLADPTTQRGRDYLAKGRKLKEQCQSRR